MKERARSGIKAGGGTLRTSQGAHRTLSSMSVASLAAGRPFGSGSRQVRTRSSSSGFSCDIFPLRSSNRRTGKSRGDPVITSLIIKPTYNLTSCQ